MENYKKTFKQALRFLLKDGTINGFEAEYKIQNKLMVYGINPMKNRIDLNNREKYDEKTISWIASNLLFRYNLLQECVPNEIKELEKREEEYYLRKENAENEGLSFRQFMKEIAFEEQLHQAEFGKVIIKIEELELKFQVLTQAAKIAKDEGIDKNEALNQANAMFKERTMKVKSDAEELKKNSFFLIKLKELQNEELISTANDEDYLIEKKRRRKYLKQAQHMLSYDMVNQNLDQPTKQRLTELQQKFLKGIKNSDILAKSGSIANSELMQNEIDLIFFQCENLIAREQGLSIAAFEIFNYQNCSSVNDVLSNLNSFIEIFEKRVIEYQTDAEETLEVSNYAFNKHINNLPQSEKIKYNEELVEKFEFLKLKYRKEKENFYGKE